MQAVLLNPIVLISYVFNSIAVFCLLLPTTRYP